MNPRKHKMDRRDFLAVTGATIACATAASWSRPSAARKPARRDYVGELLAVRQTESAGLARSIEPFGFGLGQIPKAYELQRKLTERLIERGERLTGWKIGWSTVSGRQPLGISEPGYGPLFASGAVEGPSVRTSSFCNLLVEQEIVVVLKRDIRDVLPPAELLEAIGAVHLGFELPSKRFNGVPGAAQGPTPADMIVDCMASHSYRIGPKLSFESLRSESFRLSMTREGQAFASGTTGLLDNGQGGIGVLMALSWLIERLVKRNGNSRAAALKAGDIVFTGAIPGPVLFKANGEAEVHFTASAENLDFPLAVVVDGT